MIGTSHEAGGRRADSLLNLATLQRDDRGELMNGWTFRGILKETPRDRLRPVQVAFT